LRAGRASCAAKAGKVGFLAEIEGKIFIFVVLGVARRAREMRNMEFA